MTSRPHTLGPAGEHFVMYQLLRRGLIAALAPKGVPNVDIIITDVRGDRLCAIQVKTRSELSRDGGWHMRAEHETIKSKSVVYCFVDFGTEMDALPVCYVVPSAIVADTIAKSHRQWLSEPGKNGRKREDNAVRRFLPDYNRIKQDIGCGSGWLDQYRDCWKLVGA